MVPLIERVADELDALVSVDTYKPAVAEAAIAAGAGLVNDVSGLRDPALADVCAASGAALVIMHTRAEPKHKLLDRSFDGRAAADALEFLEEKMAVAFARGVAPEQIVLDPGPDFGKTPAQTVEVLRELPAIVALGRPVLLAVSRKDFLGVVSGRPPAERDAATLAALSFGLDMGDTSSASTMSPPRRTSSRSGPCCAARPGSPPTRASPRNCAGNRCSSS